METAAPSVPSRFFIQRAFRVLQVCTQPNALPSAASFFHFVHICVFLLLLLATPGKCVSFGVCQKHMVQLLFGRIISSAPVFQVAPPFLSVTWYHLGSHNFSLGRTNI